MGRTDPAQRRPRAVRRRLLALRGRRGLAVAAAALAVATAGTAIAARALGPASGPPRSGPAADGVATDAAVAGEAVRDEFRRTVSAGWGVAPVGGPWRSWAAPDAAWVSPGAGHLRLSGAFAAAEVLSSAQVGPDVSMSAELRQGAPGGEQSVSLLVRHSVATDLRVRVTFAADGSVRLGVVTRSGTTERLLSSPVTVAGLTQQAGRPLRLQVRVAGGAPVSVRARIYPASAPAPTTWQLAVTAASGVPTGAGAVGFAVYAGTGAPSPTVFAVDDVAAGAGPVSLPSSGTPTGTSTVGRTGAVPPPRAGPTGPAVPTGTAAGSTWLPTGSGPAQAPTGGPEPDSSGYPVPAGASFVSPAGSDSAGDGSAARPWASVAKAVQSVPSGSTVVLRGGSYHESVELPAFKTITLMGYPGEHAWFDGGSALTSWTAGGGVWATPWSAAFDSRDTTGAMVDYAVNPMAAHPEQVWLDGTAQTQVGSLSAVGTGSFYVDTAAHELYLGTDPAGRSVVASTLTEAYYINHGAGSRILGVGFRRYATPVARLGAVKAYADHVTVAGSVFDDNAMAGLSVRGTGVTVTSSSFARNGQLGLQADASDGLVVDGAVASDNNTQHFRVDQAAGGIKITHSRNITVSRSVLADNIGDGLWIDQSSKYATVVHDRFDGNTHNGFQFEISAGLVAAGNEAVHNGTSGLYVLESGYAKLFNNLVVDNPQGITVLDGARVATADPADPALDHRYPLPDPLVTWEVQDVELRGNVVAGAAGDRQLVSYDDTRHRYGAATRDVTADDDAFWRPGSGSTSYFAVWGMYPAGLLAAGTLSVWQSGADQERSGVARDGGSDPYVGPTLMPTSAAPPGPPLPSDVAAALGLSAGSSIRAGLPTPTP